MKSLEIAEIFQKSSISRESLLFAPFRIHYGYGELIYFGSELFTFSFYINCVIHLFFQFVNGFHYLSIYTPPLIEI